MGNKETQIIVPGRNRFLILGVFTIYAYGLVDGLPFFPPFNESAAAFWLEDIFYFAILPIAFLYYAYRRFNFSPADYGLTKSWPAQPTLQLISASIFVCVFLGSLVLPLDFLLHTIYWKLGFELPEPSYKQFMPSGILKFPVVFYFSLSMSMMEEVVYRGIPHRLIFENPRFRHKESTFVIGTSIAFSTLHWTSGIYVLIPAFVWGLFASLLYLEFKNLWPLIGGHFLLRLYLFW